MRVCLVALLLAAVVAARRRGGHDTHSYPHSTGYSGTGSGGGHTYSSSGGEHTYSGSGGTHTYSGSGGTHTYSGSGGAHTYPGSTGLSGHSQDHGTRQHATHQQSSQQNNYHHRTEVHHHYHYSPPQQITYGSAYHPVYHGPPPVYVYEYRDSGSRFDSLLTGLALYNLGRMSASSHHNSQDFHREYSGTPGEVCKLGISKATGEYEETRIDCKLMSSFIWETSAPQGGQRAGSSSSVVTTQTNVTQSVNGGASGNNTSVTTVTVTNSTVTDALKVKGPSIEVTPGMTCYMIRISRDTSTLKKNVECGLLQEYARRSLRPNSSERSKPVLVLLLFSYIFLLS